MSTKKYVLVISLIFVIIFFSSLFSQEIGFCKSYTSCTDFFDKIAETVFISLPLFLFSLITYKMKEEVFQSWFRFVRVYMPVALLCILLAPSYSSNWIFPYNKGMAAVIASGTFTIISIVKIAVAHRRVG